MFSKFKYESIPLEKINLDFRNPRIVTEAPLGSEGEIIKYFFQHEDLSEFLKVFSSEGYNKGAERPYLIKDGENYVVIEGNTRIAAYKLLVGLATIPDEFSNLVPSISDAEREGLLHVDCSIAPSRDAMLPIMAKSHFGRGDKSIWGYLGSRKAVYEEYKSGKTVAKLVKAFGQSKSKIEDYILEYELYLAALRFKWTKTEKGKLTDPSVEFNPPVRFLQSAGHKEEVGVALDRTNLKVDFKGDEAKRKFQHVVKKLVISPEKGLGATASYADVFKDYVPSKTQASDSSAPTFIPASPLPTAAASPNTDTKSEDSLSAGGRPVSGGGDAAASENSSQADNNELKPNGAKKLGKHALFDYPPTRKSVLLNQLMKEAKSINASKFPAAATGLLRCVLEAILKDIIDEKNANPASKQHSLESAIDLCLSDTIGLGQDDKAILKEFKKSHMGYVNLGIHANVVPNTDRVIGARDCVDQFVKRNV